MEFYPGKLRIPKTPGMSAEESAVENRFAARVEAEFEALARKYDDEHGKVIDPDRAREYCPEYAASVETRRKYSRATYAPAKALADEIFRRQIETASEGFVLLLSGGAGAGKSTALAVMPEIVRKAALVVDGTLSKLHPAQDKIDRCLNRGLRVVVMHVHRPFAEAAAAVIARAREQGRLVEPAAIADSHYGAQETLFMLAQIYDGNVDVSINVICCSSASDRAREISLEELRGRYALPALDRLKNEAKLIFTNAAN